MSCRPFKIFLLFITNLRAVSWVAGTFVYDARYPSLFVMELEKLLFVSDDQITTLCQTNMSPKHYFKCFKQRKLTFNNC